MKHARSLLIALSLLAISSIAYTQTSVYGTVTLDAFGFTGTNYSSGGSFKGNAAGLIGGAFYTFPSPSRFKAGIDGRFMYSPGYKGGEAYTAAFRVGFVPHHNPLRPYFQIGGGVVSTQFDSTICDYECATTNSRLTSGVAQIAFGLDIRATDHLDIRAIDYGADAGGSNGNAHAAAAFLDAGVVYHFHSAKHP